MNKIFIFLFLLIPLSLYAEQATLPDNNLELSSEQKNINVENILDNIDDYYLHHKDDDNSKDKNIQGEIVTSGSEKKENAITTDVNISLKQNKGGVIKKTGIGTNYKYKGLTLSGNIGLDIKSKKKRKKKKKKKKNYKPRVGLDLEYEF